MEGVEGDVVIVGAGIAGLATALGLHRLGIRSLVLESADSLRTTGYYLGMWPNAWKAIDALGGIGQILRAKHTQLIGIVTTSVVSGDITAEVPIKSADSEGDSGLYAVNRKTLLETLENELPRGTIKYSSKVVQIQDSDGYKSLHLADGTILRAKVLIGCDGVNSVVAKYLGLSRASSAGRSSVRSFVEFKNIHGFEPKLMLFFGKGVRFGVVPCDDHSIYWFYSFHPPQVSNYNGADKEIVEDRMKLKQHILSTIGKVPNKIRSVIEETDATNIEFSPIRFRYPWNLLWGNISKGNVCVAGDAFHPMTPDLAQGGCSALEDSIILARVLSAALRGEPRENEQQRIRKGLENYAKERRWRSIDLVWSAYISGSVQMWDGVVLNFIRDHILAKFLGGLFLKKASFDCGKLN
ncbi:monooxygenase 2-like isoform X1 [Henckelia pumila]|uniref:monooxygenase 2-like isoform X1 n=1 Tax=Henckelia pumila TaxID=405737 RepID=UPI003C6E3785